MNRETCVSTTLSRLPLSVSAHSGCPYCGFSRSYKAQRGSLRSRITESLRGLRSYRCGRCGRVYQTSRDNMRAMHWNVSHLVLRASHFDDTFPAAGRRSAAMGKRWTPAEHDDFGFGAAWSDLEAFDSHPLNTDFDPVSLQFDVVDRRRRRRSARLDDLFEDLFIPPPSEWFLPLEAAGSN